MPCVTGKYDGLSPLDERILRAKRARIIYGDPRDPDWEGHSRDADSSNSDDVLDRIDDQLDWD